MNSYRFIYNESRLSFVKVGKRLKSIVKSLHKSSVIERSLGSSEFACKTSVTVGQDVFVLVVLPNVIDVGHVQVELEGDVFGKVTDKIRLVVDGVMDVMNCGLFSEKEKVIFSILLVFSIYGSQFLHLVYTSFNIIVIVRVANLRILDPIFALPLGTNSLIYLSVQRSIFFSISFFSGR